MTKCWFCGTETLVDRGTYSLCESCGASTSPISAPGAGCRVVETVSQAQADSEGTDKTRSRPPKRREKKGGG